MRLRTLVALTPLLLGCAHTHAQAACPWLTQGTAAGVLGGSPELTVKLVSPQEGSCSFTTRNEITRSTLGITVARQPPGRPKSSPKMTCPVGSPSLVGIGNSAVICSLAIKPPGERQLILSQVRDVYFSIVLTTVQKDARMRSPQTQRDAITMIAEQVAGNLF